MRGPQSDPSHTYAPVCPCLRACLCALTRARRVGMRGRATTTLSACCQGLLGAVWRGYNKRLSGATARFSVWPMHWPRRGILRALLGLLGALLGLCDCMGRRGRACDACFHCTKPQCWMAIQYQGYALSVWLSVWHSPSMACPQRMASLAWVCCHGYRSKP